MPQRPPTFKLRDVVEVTLPHGTAFHGLVALERKGQPLNVLNLDEMIVHQVRPEWCRLVDMTLVIKDGEWRLG